MSKRSVFTSITPLPAGITREVVLDTLHNHVEMIDLNPLVIERYQCKAPSYATAEETDCTWYTISDKVAYLPKDMLTSNVSYHGCFNDLSNGLQTHCYAPLGLDIRTKWTVGGNLPGEPREAVELGVGMPRDGLWLREDVNLRCNIMMTSFVKKTIKKAHSTLVGRLVEKARTKEAQLADSRRASGAATGISGTSAAAPQLNIPVSNYGPYSLGLDYHTRHTSMSSNASSDLVPPPAYLAHPPQQQQQTGPPYQAYPATTPVELPDHNQRSSYMAYKPVQQPIAEVHPQDVKNNNRAYIPQTPIEMEG